MFLLVLCLIAAVAAGPITYDQRQDGDFNAQVDISNIVFLFAIPRKVPDSIFNLLSKKMKPVNGEREIQDRADVRVMELFVKPSTPYHVEIGSEEKPEVNDGRVGEVVIAGKRRLEGEQLDVQEQDELKLLGATENCGPDRVRDSVTLLCKDKQPAIASAVPETPTEQKESEIEPKPEVVPS